MNRNEARKRKSFLEDTDGAVSVDWVVLTAALVGIGLAVIVSVSSGASNIAVNASEALLGASVVQIGTLGAAPGP